MLAPPLLRAPTNRAGLRRLDFNKFRHPLDGHQDAASGWPQRWPDSLLSTTDFRVKWPMRPRREPNDRAPALHDLEDENTVKRTNDLLKWFMVIGLFWFSRNVYVEFLLSAMEKIRQNPRKCCRKTPSTNLIVSNRRSGRKCQITDNFAILAWVRVRHTVWHMQDICGETEAAHGKWHISSGEESKCQMSKGEQKRETWQYISYTKER